MTRILFFIETLSLAHIGRSICLARALKKAGAQVALATDSKIDPYLKPNEFRIEPIQCSNFEVVQKNMDAGRFLFAKDTLSGYIDIDKDLIDKVSPDIVIGDLRLSLAISVRQKKVPYVSLTNCHWDPSNQKALPPPNHVVFNALGERMSRGLWGLLSSPLSKRFLREFNELREEHHLVPYSDIFTAYTDADHCLFADTPTLHSQKSPPLSSNGFHCGPALWSVSAPPPTWRREIETHTKPIVYLSMGTTGAHSIVEKCLEALSDHTVLISTAHQSEIQRQYKNVYAAPFLDSDWACSIADLIITNGGTMGSYLALSKGKPVLALTRNMDQELCMKGLVQAHAGVYLATPFFSRQRFLDKLAEVQSDKIKAGALRLQQEFKKYVFEERIEIWLKSLAGDFGPSRTPSVRD